MPTRYRLEIDLVVPSETTSRVLREIQEAAISAMKLEAPRGSSIELAPTPWHAHFGDEGCSHCRATSYADGKGQPKVGEEIAPDIEVEDPLATS